MRRSLALLVLCGLILSSGVSAHSASDARTDRIASAPTDVYSSPAALRHRAHQPAHWLGYVLYRP